MRSVSEILVKPLAKGVYVSAIEVRNGDRNSREGGQHPSDQALWDHEAMLPGPGILHSQDPFGEVELNHWSLDEISKFRH